MLKELDKKVLDIKNSFEKGQKSKYFLYFHIESPSLPFNPYPLTLPVFVSIVIIVFIEILI